MELVTRDIKSLYRKYLRAALGGALILSVYSVVDMAMVGQYQGPDGTAALAVVGPFWNIIYSLGMLLGVGGSVLFTTLRAASEGNRRLSDEYFTAAMLGTAIVLALSWAGIAFFDKELLVLFGADEHILPLAHRYLTPIKFGVPGFLVTEMLASFLRNDGAPGTATAAAVAGGVFNMIGDYVCVFVLDLGIFGAGLASAIGGWISLAVTLSHFLRKRCTLRLVKPRQPFRMLGRIVATGFSSFFLDIAVGILTVLFNRQILRWLGTDALSVYGVLINVSIFVQASAYGIGEAAQPLLSANFGAKQPQRVAETRRRSICTALFFGLLWSIIPLAVPKLLVRVFMKPTEAVLALAPGIIRRYCLAYLLMPFTISATYYFQALSRRGVSFVLSVLRGLVLSGTLVLLLPSLAGGESLWLAMPLSELGISVCAAALMKRSKETIDAAP